MGKFYVANTMPHRIYVVIGEKDLKSDIKVQSTIDGEASAELGGTALNVCAKCKGSLKMSQVETYKAEQKLEDIQIGRMLSFPFVYKEGMMIDIYEGQENTDGKTVRGNLINTIAPRKKRAIIVLNDGKLMFSKEIKSKKCPRDAFIYEGPNGKDINTYVDEGYTGKSNTGEISFHVANAWTRPVFLKAGESYKEIGTFKVENFVYREESGVQLFHRRACNTSQAVGDLYSPICRRRYPEKFTSLIVTRNGFVTESYGFIECENDAWIDVRGNNHITDVYFSASDDD